MIRNTLSSGIKLLISFIICLPLSLGAQETIHQFTYGLSTPLDGKYGREAVFQDMILYSIAKGQWVKPEIKDNQSKTENQIVWEKIEASDKGVFRGRHLRGGYLYCEYDAGKSGSAILEVSGHNEVYVNGEPRGGDVYNYGWVQHPVRLKKGINTFLFRGSRGQIKASLTEYNSDVFLSDRDPLIPDYVDGWTDDVWGAVRLINADTNGIGGYELVTLIDGEENLRTTVPDVGPLTSRKIPFKINPKGKKSGEKVKISFMLVNQKGKKIDIGTSPEFEVKIKGEYDKRKETFISDIDGSVQYYSIVPATPEAGDDLALFYSLHGASVEAVNQAGAYSPKDWGILVAPTNRRPYGFDWEDWGRLDAKEIFGLVTEKYKPDPKRLYLTGHSMGGHGTWQFGVTYPGKWAAIAPSAGWYSFWSYAGKKTQKSPNPLEKVFENASNPSNTLALSRNYLHYGIYVLHGDADDNVPVEQARFMREHLGTYHPDFCYYERPGAGHWWGNECVDWPPLFEFFRSHERTETEELRTIEFSTASPAVSSSSRFVTVWQQEKPLEISNVVLNQDIKAKTISLTCENVAILSLNLEHLQAGQPFDIICDADSFKVDPGKTDELFLRKTGDRWANSEKPGSMEKGPARSGLFKEAFQNNMIFIYGTNGSKQENAWAYQKARFDAETFWYRGNGAVDVISDAEFAKLGAAGRNVILYGHMEMNSAWNTLIPESPVKIRRGEIIMGSESYTGDDLAAYFVYPRKDDDISSVAVIAGTGMQGMISANPNRYFVSGAGFPDFMIYRSEMLEKGIDGVVNAGFFNNKWELPEK